MRLTKILLFISGLILTIAHLAKWWPFPTEGNWAAIGLIWAYTGSIIGIIMIVYAIMSSLPEEYILRLAGFKDDE